MRIKKTAKRSAAKESVRREKRGGELEVFPVDEAIKNRSWCIYGGSGTGKTTLAASFPGPVLLCDVSDRGVESVSDMAGHVMYRPIVAWQDLEETYWYLRSNPSEYKTVVIDTVSELQGKAIDTVTGWRIEDGGQPPPMSQQSWGKVSGLLSTWITHFKELNDSGIDVVFVAQERYFGGNEDADPEVQIDPEIGPRIIPSVASHLEAAASVIVYTFIRRKMSIRKIGKKRKEVGTIQFCLRVGPDPVYVTKIRKPKRIVLPDVLVDAEYNDLIDLIKGRK